MQRLDIETVSTETPLTGQDCAVMHSSTGKILPPPADRRWLAEERCRFLEEGAILYFPQSPFVLDEANLDFLRSQKQLESPYTKNISYQYERDQLRGIQKQTDTDVPRLQGIIRQYARQAIDFVHSDLTPYTRNLELEYATYRPLEEQGRQLRLRARNDLIHVDSFPTRPNYGKRILRVFTNIHTHKPRIWRTSHPFDTLLQMFKDNMPAPGPLATEPTPLQAILAGLYRALGMKTVSLSGYDQWMTQFHNFLKENAAFQQDGWSSTWSFPPGSAWLVMTDGVSHSVLSGQYALEQTFVVSLDAMVAPELAPFNVLKRTYNR